MFRQITVSSPSKVILHGEHAVVYGKSAVAASLDLRTRMCLTPIVDESVIEVDFPDVAVKKTWPSQKVIDQVLSQKPSESLNDIDQDFLAKIQRFVDDQDLKDDLQKASLTCFFYLYAVICDKFVPMNIKVESEIPLGAGLGSSAALSVCLAAGLFAIKTKTAELTEESRKQISDLALISEKILHGRPSGIDNAVCTFGGFVHFKQGKVVHLEQPSDVCLRVLLVNSKVPRKTKDLVEKVKLQNQQHPQVIGHIMDAIDGVSQSFLSTFKAMTEQGDTQEKYQVLNQLIFYNHKMLATIGVSHPRLEQIVETAKSLGLFAKLTGAGGGGFAYVLLPPFVNESLISELKEKLVKQGFSSHEATLGVNGVCVQVDNSDNECISQ